MDRTFKILMEILNKTIKILNANGYFIKDNNDKDFYIKKIYYDKNDDELYCEFGEK